MSVIINGDTGITTPAETITTNLTFTGTGNRITGDMSNAPHVNRVSFQSSVVDGATSPFIIPNGTGTIASIVVANASDPTNCSFGQLAAVASTDVRIISSLLGTGTYLPLTFYTGGSERARIDTSGNVGIGTASPAYKLDVQGSIGATISSKTAEFNAAGGSIYSSYNDATKTWRAGAGIQTAGVYTIYNATDAVTTLNITAAGLLQFNSGYGSAATAYGCRAWVNFNGTGTVAIRASGNVSSITDDGVGYYRVNFTTAMPDVNYCITGCPSDDASAATLISSSGIWGSTNQTTTSALMFVGITGTGLDRTGVTFAFFR